MAGFTDGALEKKLLELNGSQQSIQTLSLWLIHHRKHHKPIVQTWFRELRKAKPNRKLTFMYLANDVIQNSKKKGPEFPREFGTILSKAFAHVYNIVSDEKTKHGLDRIISVWEERNIYDDVKIEEFRDSIPEKKSKKPVDPEPNESDKVKHKSGDKRAKSSKSRSGGNRHSTPEASTAHHKTTVKNKGDKLHTDTEHVSKKRKTQVKEETEPKPVVKSPVGDPPDADVIIKSLQDLENSPSTDAEVREKIASLPPEVSDISLLEKIQNRESAEKLAKQVEEACLLLADYNNRLSEEVEHRKNVSKMLSDFLHSQRERVTTAEQKAEEYRDKLKRVSQVKNELKSHLQNLPDLTLLPSVTGGLAPLPSAGDLFNQS